MSLTDELQKLADLRASGELTDAEFDKAKSLLLLQSRGAFTETPVAGALSRVVDKTYWSSRWSKGNLFFRDSVTLSSDGISFRKGKMFGSQEERINYRAIASLRVTNGVFFANIFIETSGGSQPIYINGLWKSDARQIQQAVRMFQQGAV